MHWLWVALLKNNTRREVYGSLIWLQSWRTGILNLWCFWLQDLGLVSHVPGRKGGVHFHTKWSGVYSLVTFKVTSKQVTQNYLSLDYVRHFAYCGARTFQVFPLIWWPYPNFASKFEARSKPPDLLTWKYPTFSLDLTMALLGYIRFIAFLIKWTYPHLPVPRPKHQNNIYLKLEMTYIWYRLRSVAQNRLLILRL